MSSETLESAAAANDDRPFDPIEVAAQHWVDHGWGDAADGMELVTSVMRAHQLLLGHVEQELRPFGLTFARFEIVRLLGFSRRGVLPIGKIGERLQVHPASATSAVRRLARDGLVRREPHPNDRRSVLVELTDHGRSVLNAAAEQLNAAVFADLPIDRSQQRATTERLRELRRAYDRISPR